MKEKKEDRRIREALLYRKLDDELQCGLCERGCRIPRGGRGFCRSRINRNGKLYTLQYGNISSISANPIEKKPFFHFYPGTKALTVGSWSCNFTCPWCQNWDISKAYPDSKKGSYISPEKLVDLVPQYDCQGTSISFNEPTLLFEYSLEVFDLARKRGYYNTYVTNGYMSSQALNLAIEKGLDAINIDIKGSREVVEKYCGADVDKIWRNVRLAKDKRIHIEITTLIVPTVNEGEEILRGIAKKIREIDSEIPWHLSRYYPAYKFTLPPTPVETLEKARTIGREEGLRYVYLGNVPSHLYENTFCPSCHQLLIERAGFDVVNYRLTPDKRCPRCSARIPIVGCYRNSG